MRRSRYSLLVLLCSTCFVNSSYGSDFKCTGDSKESHQVTFAINIINTDGKQWETSLLVHQNFSQQPGNIDVNVTRKYTNCEGNHVVDVGAFLKELPKIRSEAELSFKRCSKNAAITNDGKTLQKLKLDGYGSGFTNRHLMDDEIFTVQINGKDGKFNHALGIGLSQIDFEGPDLPDHSYHLKSGTWMFYHSHLYQNGTSINVSYIKTNLKDVEVGHSVGVMRSRFGAIHLFIDGVDQGPAASNIPSKVYGVFELYGNVIKGTITD